ncbi:MAG TPA: hypothetical protein PLZ57_13350 [Pseudobdellovibrionaceae bacterium]|nr:hypothetical protein [Pseudobdellovibrionaceae bacterium]
MGYPQGSDFFGQIDRFQVSQAPWRRPENQIIQAGKRQMALGEKVAGGILQMKMTEADAIEIMIRLRTDGYTYQQIASWLDAKGIKTKNR